MPVMDNKVEKYGQEVFRNVGTIGQWSGLALVIGLIFAFLMAGWHWCWEGVGIVAITALACYLIGSAFGFLFCIPRSAQQPDSGAGLPLKEKMREIPRDNTNLEQISDWLVKILIGAGLVQLGKVKLMLEAVALKLSHCLLTAKAAATAVPGKAAEMVMVNVSTNGVISTNQITLSANAVPDPANLSSTFFHGYGEEFCVFLILYFLALGFLTGYLVTRLWLPFVILRSALALKLMTEDVDKELQAFAEGKKEGALKAMTEFGITGHDNPPLTEGAEGIAAEDPHKGKFGGQAEVNGLKLTADVTKMVDIDENYFRIKLRVAPTGDRSLDKPVTFHLHPTFNPDEVPVSPVGNEAVLERAAWGGFTVGVTVEGEETRLELDLAELPNAPALFKSR